MLDFLQGGDRRLALGQRVFRMRGEMIGNVREAVPDT